jgi:hypothetical protein
MKLKEILNVGHQSRSPFDLQSFDLINGQVVAPADSQYDVIKATAHTNSNAILFGIVEKDAPTVLLCSIMGTFGTVFGTQYFVVEGAWTNSSHQRTGLMTALYMSLVKHLNIKILSDKQMSPHMFDLWTGLHRLRGTKVLDIANKQVIPREQIPDAELFQDSQPTDNYRLIFEYIEPTIPELRDGTVRGYQYVTHPDKTGQYE